MNEKDSKFIFSIALKSITAILAAIAIFSSWRMFENQASRNLGLFLKNTVFSRFWRKKWKNFRQIM